MSLRTAVEELDERSPLVGLFMLDEAMRTRNMDIAQ
jgi:hypothetical protein